MSIRSIDLQVAIPRATEASKVQQVSEHQTVLQQQQFGEASQREAIKKQQQVQRKTPNEGVIVSEKKDRENQHQNHSGDENNHGTDDKESVDAMVADPVRGHLIDIKT